VYRGPALAGLAGTYFFGDFSADFDHRRIYYLDESVRRHRSSGACGWAPTTSPSGVS